jgi:hypothetical protein
MVDENENEVVLAAFGHREESINSHYSRTSGEGGE